MIKDYSSPISCILKEISPEFSLEGLMLKLKLQYLATWCYEPTHLKRPWCWERLKVGGEGEDRGWDGWMASLTQWTVGQEAKWRIFSFYNKCKQTSTRISINEIQNITIISKYDILVTQVYSWKGSESLLGRATFHFAGVQHAPSSNLLPMCVCKKQPFSARAPVLQNELPIPSLFFLFQYSAELTETRVWPWILWTSGNSQSPLSPSSSRDNPA